MKKYKIYSFFDYRSVDRRFIEKTLVFLPEDRRKKALKYNNRVDMINCIVGYLLLCYGLKTEYNIIDFRLGYEECGKPYITDHENICFNISHCKYGCVCIISDNPVGIDIQDITEVSDDVIRAVCSEKEISEIMTLDNKYAAFTKIWALKESQLKRTGEGICNDLRHISSFSDRAEIIECNEKYVIAVSV